MSCLSLLCLFLTLAICEIQGQECAQSSVAAPDNGGFLFSADNKTAQLICKAGFHPENNEYTKLHCIAGEWVGNTPANCVPYKCKRCVLEWPEYWPENGRFQFSSDSGSEQLEHQTEATVVCDDGFYPARQNEEDNKYYTTFEEETLKCNYGHWVGERKTKCIPKPGDSAKQDMYQYYHKTDTDMNYVTLSVYQSIMSTQVRKDGYKFSVLDYGSEECPEKLPLYRLYRPEAGDHLFTTDEEYKNKAELNQLPGCPCAVEGIHGACVSVKGECGMVNELHNFYQADPLFAHQLIRDVSYKANWIHKGIVCYIY